MPGSKSDYLESKILDHVLGGPDYPRPATLYIAAFLADQADPGGVSEVNGAGYARVAVSNNAASFPPAAGGLKTNAAEVLFPEATAAWGTIEAAGIMDAPVTGNLLYWSNLDPTVVINIGDRLRIRAGDIRITED